MSKNKEETQLIFKWATLSGYSFMFPKGTRAFIQKSVVSQDGTGQYYGLVFRNRQVTEVQFDVQTHKLKGFDDRSDSVHVDLPFISSIEV